MPFDVCRLVRGSPGQPHAASLAAVFPATISPRGGDCAAACYHAAPVMPDIDHIFAPDGPLAAAVAAFRARPQQLEMAQRIAEAISGNSVLVAEAGTGTGKTFAYLVPALRSGGKVIISTGTKTLQDQL